MKNKLCLLVCDIFAPETRHIIEGEGSSDVIVIPFTGNSICSPLTADQVMDAVERCRAESSWIEVLGCGCLARLADSGGLPRNCSLTTREQCLHFLASSDLLDMYQMEGAFTVSPGWLSGWRTHLDAWGFDQETAREFFHECTRKILLLDTGINPGSREHLDQFSGYLDLPAEIVPAGIEHYRLFLERVILEWRLGEQKRRALEDLSRATRKVADYEMVFDLIGRLAEIESENKVIDNILDLFEMLFAPSRVAYAAIEQGSVNCVLVRPEGQYCDVSSTAWLEALEGRSSMPKPGSTSGFLAGISRGDTLFGLVEVEGIAFPEHMDHYLGVASAVASVCGIAIANARTYGELETVNLELDGFTRTVSHDLKSPLASITMAAELLQGLAEPPIDDHSLEEIRTIAGVVQESGIRGAGLINDLLNLAHAAQAPVKVAELDVRDVLTNVISDQSESIRRIGARVLVSEDMGSVVAHNAHLYQLFLNLISNSLKHNDAPGLVVEVRYLGCDDDGAHRYQVRDNGPGISPENLEKIFIPFFKGAKSQGTGIGLSTVEKIIRLYGGSIQACNDKGACFEFTIKDYPG